MNFAMKIPNNYHHSRALCYGVLDIGRCSLSCAFFDAQTLELEYCVPNSSIINCPEQ